MSYIVIGADVSLAHAALVALDEHGDFLASAYAASKKKDVVSKLGGELFAAKKKDEDRNKYDLDRLEWIFGFYDRWIGRFVNDLGADDVYASLEGYAYGKASQSRTFEIGEATGIFKIVCRSYGVKLRINDPISMKTFATNLGNASKEEVREALEVMAMSHGLDFDKYPTERDGGVRADIVDAYGLGRMLWTELQVRSGDLELKKLPESTRRFLLRTTKTYPVNVLERPWT